MIYARLHDDSRELNNLKCLFDNSTICFNKPCLTYIKNTKSLYRIISQLKHNIVGVHCSGLRGKQYKVTVHFHILNRRINVVIHLWVQKLFTIDQIATNL